LIFRSASASCVPHQRHIERDRARNEIKIRGSNAGTSTGHPFEAGGFAPQWLGILRANGS
jgi:hypothetical protein